MTAIAPPTLKNQLHDALIEVRAARHHCDCRCGQYQRLWCTPAEKVWCNSVDRILEQIRRASF